MARVKRTSPAPIRPQSKRPAVRIGFIALLDCVPLLAADDSLRAYIDRGVDVYGGLGREAPLQPLFEPS